MKRIWSLFAVLALLCALTIPALAAAGGAADAEPAAQTVSEEELARSEENTTKVRKIWAVAALIGVACFGGALGMAHSVAKAANNMAEQPEAAGQIRTSMMMGLVFIETVIIYALHCLLPPLYLLKKKGRGQGSVKKTKRCCKAAVNHEGRLAFPACRWYK